MLCVFLIRRVVMHQLVLPSEVDGLGICFGGQVCVCVCMCVCVCVCVCQVLRYMFGTLVSVSALCWAPQETVGTEARPQAPRSALFYEP